MPALLKGFLDRVLTPGFAFRHISHDKWDKLLAGRTADLITTMDTPPLVYRFIYRSPGRQALAPATLGYCGVRTVRAEVFGPVVASSATQRNDWLARARASGALGASPGRPLAMTPYLLGYLTLFLLEAATVFLNDWFDFDSDRRNRHAGLFTGGSRVLVEGRLDRSAMRKGIVLALTFIFWFCVPPLIVLVRAGAL